MTKRQKREEAMRRNPKQVRFEDLHTLLNGEGFAATVSGSHDNDEHATYADLDFIVVRPHGTQTHVLPIYVRRVLDAVEEARHRLAGGETT